MNCKNVWVENYNKSAFVTFEWVEIEDFGAKNSTFTSKCSKCINMHQNTSKCMQNELCKGFVHEINKELVLITSKGAKINEIHLPLYGGTPCSCIDLAKQFARSKTFHIFYG